MPVVASKENFRKNIVKVNLSSLALENYSLGYERSLTRKMTCALGFNVMPETTLSSIFLVERAIDLYLQDYGFLINELNLASIANNSFNGEARFYAGRHSGARGLYVSVYGRYASMKAAYPYNYGTNDNTYLLPLQGAFKGLGGGVMIGAQWLISKRMTFDWYMLGGHYGKTDIAMSAAADLSSLSTTERKDLEGIFEGINDSFKGVAAVDASVTDQGLNVTGKGPFAGIRSLGFNLGMTF
ncbi:DUF3575 domain-containing protein [Pontibacter ummariensis]|uniref:DUF3575 domain-containing protein n=1 Tax=Pontibacter ummariensis TaxID=1610492 RepID=UPI0015E5AE2C|nr:DUF3575 domain-containing protein [Pontibacter ummariensis]